MIIETTIAAKYVSSWGIWESVRELVQNGVDAETEFYAKLTVTWVPSTVHAGTVKIENQGTTLDRKALLMGHSTKSSRDDLRGQYGEGLKLGCLAAAREGYKVVIRTGDETWVPEIRSSEKFGGEDVLAFDIQGGRKFADRVCVEIQGISKETWDSFKSQFLFLNPRVARTDVTYGSLLTDSKYKGMIFVKGIFVQRNDDLQYGYDLRYASTDRDRRMVDYWELTSHTRRIWNEVVTEDTARLDSLFALLNAGAKDVEGFESSYSDVDEEIALGLAVRFEDLHGKDVYPVTSSEEAVKMEHLGVRTARVPKVLQKALKRVVGDYTEKVQALTSSVVEVFSRDALDASERETLDTALLILDEAGGMHGLALEIVSFRDDGLLGTFCGKDERVRIARHLLEDLRKTLETLVHEVAHLLGGDGEKAHVAAVEALWSKIAMALWTR